MNKLKYLINKYKKCIIISLIICLILVLYIISFETKTEQEDKIESISYALEEDIKTVDNVDSEKTYIKVEVKGAVVSPGVYELEDGSRVQDAINKADGLSKDSNTKYINMSKKLIDEMVIIVYTNDEIKKYEDSITKENIVYIEKDCTCPDNINDACITNENTNTLTTSNSKTTASSKISINTASLEELMTLNGIGESKAQAIIDYREKNGKFEKLEEIMNVSGIGESAYSKIKDNIEL